MTYHDPDLHGISAADSSAAAVQSDLTMDGFGQFAALRPSLMTRDLAVFYDKADIAVLSERMGLDVPLDRLHRIEVRQDAGLVSLRVEFTSDENRKDFLAKNGAQQLQEAAESLVRRAGNPFFEEELPISETPGLNSRGELQSAADIRNERLNHEVEYNASRRELLAQRKGPPSWGGDTWDGEHNNADGPHTVREMQRKLIGKPSPLVEKIQDAADRSKELPKREGALLPDKQPHARSGRLEVKRHARVKDTPPNSEHSR